MNKLKTVNIKGKEYVEVNERLKHFRSTYKGWCLTSDVVDLTEDRCVIKATIFDDTGKAFEQVKSDLIKKNKFDSYK